MTVTVTTDGDLAILTIDRPEALNALNSDVLDAIRNAADTDAKALIVTGAGKAFVAGADIAQMKDFNPEQAEEFSLRGQAAFQALQDFPGPVLAAINGFALGGGLEVALACDILLASEKAKVGLPETTLAVVPGFGGTQRLPRRVGPGWAKRLMFTGEILDAESALAIGLVDSIHPADELLEDAKSLARQAIKNGPLAVKECKRLVDHGMDMPLGEAIAMESRAFGAIFATADRKEGMAAFLEKRKASFRGA